MDSWYSASDLRPCAEVRSATKSISVVAAAPTIQTRSMANRASLTGSSNASAVDQEPPKRTSFVHHDPIIKRQRKDSNFFSRPKNVSNVIMGPFDVDAWYFSPYHFARPQVRGNLETCSPVFLTESISSELSVRDFVSGSSSGSLRKTQSTVVTAGVTLHLCPFCLEHFLHESSVVRHLQSACTRHPPGNEVYRDVTSKLTVFELDGSVEHTFAKHLALLSKLFLEHKALDCDMKPFLFYVLCEITPLGCMVLGYFSKEKVSPDNFNLSCILTLPQFQGRGIGRFLVELSYELSRREGKPGSPEKPLSDLGEITYMSYWRDAVMDVLTTISDKGAGVSIEGIVSATFMTQQDVIATLQKLNILAGLGGGKLQGGAARKATLCVTSEHIRQHEERKARRLQSHGEQQYVFDAAFLCWDASWYTNIHHHSSTSEPTRANFILRSVADLGGE